LRLEVKNLYKRFSDTEILHGISFAVESGMALGFLGRNGAGKTTTIRILMDLFMAMFVRLSMGTVSTIIVFQN